MAHRVLNGEDEVRQYEQYLDDGWPARTDVIGHLCSRLTSTHSENLRVLELGCGPGALAKQLLETGVVTEYVGIDISEASIAYAQKRVANAKAVTKWLAADLNGNDWMEAAGRDYDAILSMQSIHDIGGVAEIVRLFGIVGAILRPGGRFVYADLLRLPSDAPDSNRGRFYSERHLALLEQSGFVDTACTRTTGGFACFEASVQATA